MSEKLVLTFDVGTQSTRAMLVNKKGQLEDVSQYSYETPYISEERGHAEQYSDFYFDAICGVSNKNARKSYTRG